MKKKSELKKDKQLMMLSIEELVLKEHLVRKIERVVDWSFIYEIVAPYYGERSSKY